MTLDEVVAIRPVPGGVELHIGGEAQGVVVWLDADAALSLADDLTRACERPLPVAA